MVNTVDLPALDQAIVARLEAALDWPVGYADVPAGAGWQGEPGASAFRQYVIVDPDPANYLPTMASAHAFTAGEWRIRAVSTVPGPVRDVAQQARAALLGLEDVIDVRMVESSGPRRDELVVPTLFYAVEVVAIQAAPTP